MPQLIPHAVTATLMLPDVRTLTPMDVEANGVPLYSGRKGQESVIAGVADGRIIFLVRWIAHASRVGGSLIHGPQITNGFRDRSNDATKGACSLVTFRHVFLPAGILLGTGQQTKGGQRISLDCQRLAFDTPGVCLYAVIDRVPTRMASLADAEAADMWGAEPRYQRRKMLWSTSAIAFDVT
jgi:hypothetical protein